jgi:hypothetical protein
MIKQKVSPKEVVNFLNECFKLDKIAIEKLVNSRVRCNEKLENHPTIQCGEDKDGNAVVGLLGILNGIFGADKDGWGVIAAYFDKNDKLQYFCLLKEGTKGKEYEDI